MKSYEKVIANIDMLLKELDNIHIHSEEEIHYYE